LKKEEEEKRMSYRHFVPLLFLFGVVALVLAGGKAGRAAEPAIDLQAGKAVYGETCVACHGEDGQGVVPGMPDFTDREGSLSKPDSILLENMANGIQNPGALMAMPPHGGNHDLTEQDLKNVLAYLRQAFGS
jgi:mono/diheme cytochrome c family protein